MSPEAPIEDVRVKAFEIPTASPESDGTLEWSKTTLVYVEIVAAATTGIGYTYADESTATLIQSTFRELLIGKDAFEIRSIWNALYGVTRNLGESGITSMAVSAVDVALWDLKGKALGVSSALLLGAVRERVAIYGSGGFTSYDEQELCRQLTTWVSAGIPRVKMKIGRDPRADVGRVRAARAAIGDAAELFVDANGAYDTQLALAQAERFAEQRVSWFEEPIFREDYRGTRAVRERVPVGMDISIGEYGYRPYEFQRMIDAQSMDVLQADATRCGGYTGLLIVDALCRASMVPLSTHCAPSLHISAALACAQVRHVEYFFDHVRIERMLFDGVLSPEGGTLRADVMRPGIGLELRSSDAARFVR